MVFHQLLESRRGSNRTNYGTNAAPTDYDTALSWLPSSST
jgi:hypothetical protein